MSEQDQPQGQVTDDNQNVPQDQPQDQPAPPASLDLEGIERGHRLQAVVKAFLPEGVDLEEEMKHVNLKVKPDGTLDGDVYYRPPQAATPKHPLAGNPKGAAIVGQRLAQASAPQGEDYESVRESIRAQKIALGLAYDDD